MQWPTGGPGGAHVVQCPWPLLLCLAIWWVQSRTCLFVYVESWGGRGGEREIPQVDSLLSAESNTELQPRRACCNLYFPNHEGLRWFLVIH